MTGILVCAVKGLRIEARERIELTALGVRENRRFFLVDPSGRMVNAKQYGALQTVRADYSDAQRTLTLHFPAGAGVSAPIEQGQPLAARFFKRTLAAVEVLGPFSQALSDHVGAPLRLVESVTEWGAVDRGRDGAVSLISTASLERLTSAAAAAPIDARRFRMLIEVDGIAAHEEDDWIGLPVAIGGAVVEAAGHVGRCVVTNRDPENGVTDLDTLGALATYRREAPTTEALAFGVYGRVRQAGTVALGDAVESI